MTRLMGVSGGGGGGGMGLFFRERAPCRTEAIFPGLFCESTRLHQMKSNFGSW